MYYYYSFIIESDLQTFIWNFYKLVWFNLTQNLRFCELFVSLIENNLFKRVIYSWMVLCAKTAQKKYQHQTFPTVTNGD